MGLLTTASAYYYSFVVLPGQKLVSLLLTSQVILAICVKQRFVKPLAFLVASFFQFVYVSRLPICKIFIPFTGDSTSQRGRLCSKRYGSSFFSKAAQKALLSSGAFPEFSFPVILCNPVFILWKYKVILRITQSIGPERASQNYSV